MRPISKHGKIALLLNCSSASLNLTMPVFCILEICLIDLLPCSEGRTESDNKSLSLYYSFRLIRFFFFLDSAGFKMVWPVLWLNIKYWTSCGLNSVICWLGLFTNRTFTKHHKLVCPHKDFIICIVSLAIFHPHFVIRTFPIRILSSEFFHPQFIIRIFLSAIRRHPVHILQRPNKGQ